MTLTLDLPPAVTQTLEHEAGRRGITLDALLLQLAAQEAARLKPVTLLPNNQAMDPEVARDLALMDELDALADRLTKNTPPLVDDAVARVYQEREDAQLDCLHCTSRLDFAILDPSSC